ncbi:MAG: zinc metalloprotease [Planctomycetota bacterium]
MGRCVSLALVAGLSVAATAQVGVLPLVDTPSRGVDLQVVSETEIYIDGELFGSWGEVADAGVYTMAEARCGTFDKPVIADGGFDQLGRVSPADCSFNRTNIDADYDPSVERYRIPVVVHVIQSTNGTGNLSDAQVRSQIDILNEDFQAIAGTNGAPGTDMNVEFFLATEDPNGNPTNGITRSTNNQWFNDGGGYWNSLAWDTNRYLNIYSNSASGALGYVADFPQQSGYVGSNADRVVVLYSTFGRNAPFSPFNLGRTGTHEVGHYFGLFHTFSGGCASQSNCYNNGDLVCDTNNESSPFFGCSGGRTTCGTADPIDNYMDYSDDRCMNKFTPEQVNRMRCTLLNYRPDLYEIEGGTSCNAADLAAPFGFLDLADTDAFISAFLSGDAAGDLVAPFGFFDLSDVDAFIADFLAGCS